MRQLAVVLAVLLAANAAFAQGTVAPAPTAASDGGRILVMPFENLKRDPKLHWIGEAAALLLADDLGGRGLAAIRRAERVRAFEELQLPRNAVLSRATVIKVGELVGASEVIVGSVALEGDDLLVEANSIRIDVGRLQPHVRERGPLVDVEDLFDRIAGRLAPDASPREARAARPPLGAFENYVKGLMAESSAARATFLEEAIRLHPDYDRARLALWDVRTEQGAHTAALTTVRSVRASSPLAARAAFLAAVSMLELRQFDEAYDAFTALSKSATGSFAAAIYNNLGIVQLRRNATTQSGLPTYFLTQAADLDPGDEDILFNLGYAYVLELNNQGALYWLREALRRNPADAEAHYVLSTALAATGATVEATREKELAGQLSTEHAELEKRAAADKLPVPRGLERLRYDPTLRESPRSEQTIVNTAQREQRSLAVFHLDRGRRLYEREEDREAMAELRRAVYLSPYEAQAHLLIGRIHLRSGRTAQAVDALKISIWSEETVAARLALAEAYLKLQNTGAAKTELQRVLVLDPASAEAKRLLASLGGG